MNTFTNNSSRKDVIDLDTTNPPRELTPTQQFCHLVKGYAQRDTSYRAALHHAFGHPLRMQYTDAWMAFYRAFDQADLLNAPRKMPTSLQVSSAPKETTSVSSLSRQSTSFQKTIWQVPCIACANSCLFITAPCSTRSFSVSSDTCKARERSRSSQATSSTISCTGTSHHMTSSVNGFVISKQPFN